MNRSRTLILLGIVLALGAVLLLVLAPQNNSSQAPTPPPPPVVQTTMILVAAQNIPRGTIIGPDAVVVLPWPNNSLPPSELILTGPDQVKSTRARTDIYRGQPVLKSMIVAGAGELAAIGHDAALFIPPGKVAVSFEIDKFSSVGYAVGTGDHVDMIVTFGLVDANRDGQFPTIAFNQELFDKLKNAGVPPEQALTQVLPDSGKTQQPRLLSQMVLQNIEVLHVGEWPASGAVPNPLVTPTPNAPSPSTGPTPTPIPRPTLLLLLVDPQQALILQWLRAANVNLSLALRAAGDNAPRSTDTVTYQYILTNFNISIPPKLDTLIQSGALNNK
jgi:Flp pilus assembly protein CpaB